MFCSADYQLLDFGEGRKLERFGSYVLDRPAPAAERIARSQPEVWRQATVRFETVGDQRGGARGRWIPDQALSERWNIGFDPLRFELKPTDFGHLGVFPEQAANWDWIARQIRGAATASGAPADGDAGRSKLKILNLFAYTGGSTLAAAASGSEVVHVDSARGTVAWARRNAELSGLAEAPVRWIVEDAARFVRRELDRKNYYDAVILDPPSYGHGPAGETWKLEDQLGDLLADCARLTAGRRRFILLTCHTPSISPAAARELLTATFQSAALQSAADSDFSADRVGVGELSLQSVAGGLLPCGVVARWPGD
jgi:23S rRNA (cytosine1962-C5)-methyltransferase